MRIIYRSGDATHPAGSGNKIIVHICNDIGHWGGGFTGAISRRWLKPQMAYHHFHTLHDTDRPMELGTIQLVKVERDIWVANVIGQHGTGNRGYVPPIRYDAVRAGLKNVRIKAARKNASVHMPRIGCGLAGGNWERMEQIIHEELTNHGIDVTVYTPGAEVDEVEEIFFGRG